MNRFALLAAMVVALSFGFAAPAFAGPCDGPNPPFFCPQPDPEPEPQGAGGSSNTNTNTNNADASGFGIGVGLAGGGDASSRANGGDASSRSTLGRNNDFGGQGGQGGRGGAGGEGGEASATAFGAQGQMQGQIGIQGQLGILDNENDLSNSNSSSTSTSTSNTSSTATSTNSKNKQGQDQTAVGTVDSHDSVTVEGDDIVYEAPDIPVNSAAPVFAGACSQGVSIQTQSFGGSAGTTNPVCDYVAVAGGFIAAGDRDDALRVLEKAEDAADWRYRFSQIRSVLTLGLL